LVKTFSRRKEMAKGERETITKEDVRELKEVDPEVQAKRDAARLLRNEAKTRLRDFAKTLEDDDALKADLFLIIGTGQRAGGIGRVRVNMDMAIRDLFLEEKEIHEMDIFKNFKIGRPQMTNKIRIFLKVPNPDDRIWVRFFPDEETYRIVGKGANPPKDWEGFVPADENIL